MRTIPRHSSPLLIAASVLLGSAAVRSQSPQEVATPRAAQEVGIASATSVAPRAPEPAAQPAASAATTVPRRSSNGLFTSLYIGFATTQVLDVHSTLRALDAGHREANPMMQWATDRPAAFVALKTATTAGTLFVAERVRRHHPKAALIMMTALDTAYSFVVAKNYSVPMPRR